MKARLAFMLALFVLFGLMVQAQADSDTSANRPDYYRPIFDSKNKRPTELHKLQNGKLNQKDLNAFAAEAHSVSVLSTPDAQPDVLPASARPQGDLKLIKIFPEK